MSQASAVINEQHLSQQFQHLSPFQHIIMGESSPTRKGMDFDIIPDYLSENNPYLETKLQVLSVSWLSKIKELRDIAILMHQIKSIELVRSLWLIYRRSGTGNLPTPFPIDRSDSKIWPEEVRSLALSHRQFRHQHLDDEDEDPYLAFVDQQLMELLTHITNFEQKLRIKQNSLSNFDTTIEAYLVKIIQDGLECQRMDIELHIDMVEYDFIDILLKRQYQTLALDQKQVG